MTPDAGSGDARAPIAACPYTGPPLIDLSTLAACGTVAGAHCLSAKLVPATEVALLATCVGGYCVPDTFIVSGGNFSPATCRAAGDIEGRCLHEALPDVARQESSLAQSTCTAEERCVPCFDPLSAKDTGACHLGCDIGPHEPATLYASCCQGPHSTVPRGTCIPSEIIPASEQTNLAVDSCLAGKALCVPDEQLNHVAPVTCAATPSLGKPFQGVCLSACLTFDFISSLGMAQGTCDDLHVCVPCTNPITNQPTGAPGCPP